MQDNNFIIRYKKIAIFLLYVLFAIVIAAICVFVLKYIIPLIYPFIIAWIVAWMIQPIIKFLDKHAKIPKKISVCVLVFLLIAILGTLFYLIIQRTITELMSLFSFINDKVTLLKSDSSAFDDKVVGIINKIEEIFPWLDVSERLLTYWENIGDKFISFLTSSALKISNNILPFLVSAISSVGNGFFAFLIIVVSSFYIAIDFNRINTFLKAQLPEKSRRILGVVRREFVLTTGRYLRAYALIIAITFIELFIGFSLLRIEYAFLLAFITALVDILPILGTGTILVPWAAYLLLIEKDITMGIAIAAIYIIITVVRQIIEPKIVGSYIGLYPLVTLIMMFAGLKAFGIFGLFLFPIAIIILKNLNDEGHIKLWKMPPELIEPEQEKKERLLKRIFNKFTSKNANKK